MLFEKSVSELQEEFVRNRFAEDQYFRRSDIEEWLESQRKAKTPDDATWGVCIPRKATALSVVADDLVGCLRKYAYKGGWGFLDKKFNHLEKLMYALNPKVLGQKHDSEVEVYYPIAHGPVVLIRGHQSNPWTIYYFKDGKSVEMEITTKVVLNAIYGAWVYDSPKRNDARKFLCDLLAQDIALVRAKAEMQFDQAIAVSADGKKIISAQYVAVMPNPKERGPVLFYRDASVFRENKILRGAGHLDRQGIEVSVEKEFPIVLKWLANWRLGWHGGHFETIFFPGLMRDSLLIVPRRQCPEPLPEGGEEVLGLII